MVKREKTLRKFGNVWKVTIRVPDMATANTKTFRSKKKAEEWLDKW